VTGEDRVAEALRYEETSRKLDTDAGTIHHHVAGDGPPLLLLHGSGPGVSGWANFQHNLPVFAERFTTYVPDLPGFGASELPEGRHPLAGAADAVVAFLDAAGLDRVSIVGNSMGGGVGSTVAATHPERVDRLVTLGGVGVNVFSPSPPEGIKLLVEFVEEPTRERMVAWLHSMVYDEAHVTEELIDLRMKTALEPHVLAASRAMYSRAGLAYIRDQARNTIAPPWAHLPRIQAPTLITWGRDDRVTPLDWCLLPMRMIPKCELHVFYDCGHWAMIERKAEFESTVGAFLTRDR
jgi:pimeloyl-ACP methyl ester carboxylesterase